MIIFKAFDELANFNEEIHLEFKAAVSEQLAEYPESTLDECFGGNVNIVENMTDILQVKGVDGVCILTNTPTFDAIWYLPSKSWIAAMLATNNAGGEIYLIPLEIFSLVPNVGMTVIKNNEDGKYWHSFRGPLNGVIRVSPFSCADVTRLIPFTPEEDAKWRATGDIEASMPHLTSSEREFVNAGILNEESAVLMPSA